MTSPSTGIGEISTTQITEKTHPFRLGESEKNIREDTSLFVKESVRRLCQQRDEAAAKRLCESVGRLWEEGRVEESVGEEAR